MKEGLGIMAEQTPERDSGSDSKTRGLLSRPGMSERLILEMWQQDIVRIEINSQTDRGLVIVGVGRVDQLLADALKSRFIISDDETDFLFRPDAALSSLDAKTRLAYAIGMIGPRVVADLGTVRNIRNK